MVDSPPLAIMTKQEYGGLKKVVAIDLQLLGKNLRPWHIWTLLQLLVADAYRF